MSWLPPLSSSIALVGPPSVGKAATIKMLRHLAVKYAVSVGLPSPLDFADRIACSVAAQPETPVVQAATHLRRRAFVVNCCTLSVEAARDLRYHVFALVPSTGSEYVRLAEEWSCDGVIPADLDSLIENYLQQVHGCKSAPAGPGVSAFAVDSVEVSCDGVDPYALSQALWSGIVASFDFDLSVQCLKSNL